MAKRYISNLPNLPGYQNSPKLKIQNGMVTNAELAQYLKELATHKGKEQEYTSNVHSAFSFGGFLGIVA